MVCPLGAVFLGLEGPAQAGHLVLSALPSPASWEKTGSERASDAPQSLLAFSPQVFPLFPAAFRPSVEMLHVRLLDCFLNPAG